uniref:GED domain-containing protein n=1 Tax=Fusarium oxysporum (strain Fo5176) TaxID=660025 RepID=A0A0D2XUE6_FUSOF
MAGPVEVLSMHPHALDTPPRTPYKGVDSLNSGKESPRKVIGKFPTDSSLGDVFYDPSPTSVSSPRPRDDSNQEIMPEDPFDSQHNRILFDAIDALQSFGAGDLRIPQLIIVGGQSSGKSSLLQSLTGIPFPVDSGCCTRFPTRIVSRRTEPDSDDSFRITIDPAEVDVPGLDPASDNIKNYECSGKILTKERFAKISSEFMGLRTGLGEDRKNFVAEVLKIELSGPHRSYFSILDLPGTFQNASAVNETDQAKVEAMVKEYMNNEDNIVILGRLPGGWFLVRNRADKDPDSFDLSAAEKKLFSKSPWNSVSQSRLGSTAAKSYLGTLLSSKIRDCFPTLRSTIQHNLEERQHEKTMLGEPRTSHAARQQFVVATVRKYEEMAQTALDRPGFLDHSMELRREVSRLNAEFDKFMRARGGTWEFEDAEVDPRVLLDERLALETQARAEDKQLPSRVRNVNKTKLDASLDKAFPGLSQIQDTRNLMGAIQEKLALYQGSLLDGIINPDIYPDMYREQVKKWGHIANIHLARVAQAVNRCTASILNDVCPAESDTSTLSRELTTLLEASWKESMQRTEDLCKSQCEMETKCVRLQSTGPRFGDEIHGWRILRFYEGLTNAWVDCDPGHLDLPKCFESVHQSLGKNMVLDVHDVLKVYYKLSLDAFIRTINNTVIESFISGQDGPVLGLNTNRILSLSEDEMKIVGGENENTARRRKELEHDIEKLQRCPYYRR